MSKHLFLVTIVINFLAVGIETDLYIPALPLMLLYFKTQELYLQQLLSVNLLGLFIGSLIFGSLSDKYSGKNLLLLGHGIFFISSISCTLASSINTMIFLRFIQGIGAASPITISTSAIFSQYDKKQASIFLGILNGIFTIGMALAPLIGNALTLNFGWKSCFWTISVLSIFAFSISIFTFPSNTQHTSKNVSYQELFQKFIEISLNKKFQLNTLIFSLMIACLNVYIANLSLIFINGLNVPQAQFGYYQALSILPCIVFSFLSSHLINKLGVLLVRFISLLFLTIGTIIMCLASFFSKSPLLISLSMMIITTGTSLGIGIFLAQALSQFPTAVGTASSVVTSLRLILTASFISFSGIIFNNTMLPLTIVIISITSLILLFHYFNVRL